MSILVRDRKFFSQLANGETFSLNASDFGTHLKGSAMENLQALITVDISWDSLASASAPFDVFSEGSDIFRIVRTSGSWITDLFSIGDALDMFELGFGALADGTVIAINDTDLVVDSSDLTTEIPAGSLGSTTFQVLGKTELTGVDYRFGLIGQDEVFNFQSKVDTSDQIYTAPGVGNDPGGGRITTFVDMDSKGQIKGWVTGTARARYVSNPTTYVQRFEIEHTFIINPYYLEGEFTDLENDLQPDRFVGDNTLRYVSQFEFRNVLSNPNTAKLGRDDISLGSVGGFGQNFNGFNEKYSIVSIAYEEVSSGDPSDGIIVAIPTKVTVVVNSIDGTFVNNTSIFGVYHSFLPPQDTYENNTDEYRDIWLFDNQIQTVGSAATGSGIITLASAVFDSVNQITITFNVTFTTAQQALIDSDDNYVIGVQVSDTSLSTDDSDKLILKAAARNYVKNADVTGLLFIDEFDFFPHAVDVTGSGFTDVKGWNEDGIVSTFRVHTPLAEEAVIDSLKYKLVAFNTTTEDEFVLDEFVFNYTSTFVPDTPGDIQQLSVDTTRGFRLQPTDQFNSVEFATNNRIVNDQFFNGEIAFKIRWEEWIAQADANPIFFDAAQQNNGLNKKSSNYFAANGYNIYAVLEFGMIQDGATTFYEFFSPAFNIQDYDQDAGANEWTAVLTTETPLGSPLVGASGPAILTDDETTFISTWTQTAGAVTDISDFIIIHRIQERNETGQQIEELSSLVSRAPADNPKLIGIIGESRTKITLVGGEVVGTCRIDFNELDPTKDYDISARLLSLTNTPIIPLGAKLKENDDVKLKEDDDTKLKDP